MFVFKERHLNKIYIRMLDIKKLDASFLMCMPGSVILGQVKETRSDVPSEA